MTLGIALGDRFRFEALAASASGREGQSVIAEEVHDESGVIGSAVEEADSFLAVLHDELDPSLPGEVRHVLNQGSNVLPNRVFVSPVLWFREIDAYPDGT